MVRQQLKPPLKITRLPSFPSVPPWCRINLEADVLVFNDYSVESKDVHDYRKQVAGHYVSDYLGKFLRGFP